MIPFIVCSQSTLTGSAPQSGPPSLQTLFPTTEATVRAGRLLANKGLLQAWASCAPACVRSQHGVQFKDRTRQARDEQWCTTGQKKKKLHRQWSKHSLHQL